MTIAGKQVKEIVITAEDGEVLAVISDTEVIEKNGVSVVVEWLS